MFVLILFDLCCFTLSFIQHYINFLQFFYILFAVLLVRPEAIACRADFSFAVVSFFRLAANISGRDKYIQNR